MSPANELEPQSQAYSEKLNNLSQTFLSVLDDFKKYYVFYNKNPEVDEYQQYFVNSKSQLQTINKDVFEISKNLGLSIEKINDELIRLNVQLESEKKLKTELKTIVDNLYDTNRGAKTMNEDATIEYTNQYYKNVEIFIGSLVLVGLIAMVNKSKSNK